MYLDGQHIGYAKVENAHVRVFRRMLETSSAAIVDTTNTPADEE
jgi:hypothetical protein